MPGLTLVSQPFSCGQCTAVEARNRVPFKGILRFLDHYPCENGRKKLHSERGAWGLVAVQGSLPASGDPGDMGHSAGAAPVTRGRKSIPSTSLSSLRDQDGFSVPIQVCVSPMGEIALNVAAAAHGRAVLLHGGSGGALLALMRPWCVPSGQWDPLCFSLPGGTAWPGRV